MRVGRQRAASHLPSAQPLVEMRPIVQIKEGSSCEQFMDVAWWIWSSVLYVPARGVSQSASECWFSVKLRTAFLPYRLPALLAPGAHTVPEERRVICSDALVNSPLEAISSPRELTHNATDRHAPVVGQDEVVGGDCQLALHHLPGQREYTTK